ncbi:MAG TPA: calcium-binding protein [Leptolyngbyaceae cyanobacterium M33_DOE_097]|uniref:Calcium-binding protein n=1 Tax=Oscillatoriales cyanobacterium SpSt-418 TaxID=2282169 RepID=A0A7C3KCM1_9CYAN|nr:calcium-binding protein [Leptolyngbyaceae cyanobacterium M33_DOE_097]
MLTDLQKRKLIKLFTMYDGDCDGFLVAEDYENVAKKIAAAKNLGFRSIKCQTLMSQFAQDWKNIQKLGDESHDNKVTLDEWLNYHEQLLANKEKYIKEVKVRIDLLLDAFDADENGKFSQTEWGTFLGVHNVSPVYAPLVFPTLDSDNDGFITKSEVLALIEEFYFSDDPNAAANMMFGPY